MGQSGTSRLAAAALLLAIVAHTVLFSGLLIARHHALVSHDPRDEAVNNQILYNTAHGLPVLSTIKGLMRFHGHFRPVFFVAAIPWLIYPHAETWYVCASLTLSLSALWVFRIARRKFLSDWQGLIWAAAFLAYLPLNEINLGNYDPEILAVLPLTIGFDLYLRRRLWPFLLAALCALACKENLGIVLVGYSLHALLSRRGPAWVLLPGLLGAGWMALCIELIIPLYYPLHELVYLRFVHEQPSLAALALYLLAHPLQALSRMAWGQHPYLARRMLGSGGYLALFSPLTLLLAAPTAALIMLQELPVSVRQTHLLTGATPFVFLAGLLGARRAADRLGRALAGRGLAARAAVQGIGLYALLAALAGNLGMGLFGQGQDYGQPGSPPGSISSIYDPRNFLQTEFAARAGAAAAQIRPDETVLANDRLLPALSERTMLWEIGMGPGGLPRADAVLLNLTGWECHNCTFNQVSPGQLNELADRIEAGDYRALCADQELVFLHRERGELQRGAAENEAAALLRAIAAVRRGQLHRSLAVQAQLGWRNVSQGRP